MMDVAPAVHDELLTVSVVARELGISEGAVRLMTTRGELPCRRLSSGDRLFLRVDVDRVRAARVETRSK